MALGVRGLGICRPAAPYLESTGPIAMAHRGFDLHGRENSMAAFQAAVDLGFRYLETDVHATADGVLLAFHDQTLDRVTDAHGVIGELPWSAVARARIGGTEPIPRLEDVLGTFGQVRVNIDVKHRSAIAPLVQVLRRTGAVHRVCVASFSDRRRGAVVRAVGPDLATSLGVPRTTAFLAASLLPRKGALGRLLDTAAVQRLAARGAVCLQLPRSAGPVPVITARTVEVAQSVGLQVHAWTINDPGQMRELLDLGVDGLVTDRADLLRDVLHARGQWQG